MKDKKEICAFCGRKSYLVTRKRFIVSLENRKHSVKSLLKAFQMLGERK